MRRATWDAVSAARGSPVPRKYSSSTVAVRMEPSRLRRRSRVSLFAHRPVVHGSRTPAAPTQVATPLSSCMPIVGWRKTASRRSLKPSPIRRQNVARFARELTISDVSTGYWSGVTLKEWFCAEWRTEIRGFLSDGQFSSSWAASPKCLSSKMSLSCHNCGDNDGPFCCQVHCMWVLAVGSAMGSCVRRSAIGPSWRRGNLAFRLNGYPDGTGATIRPEPVGRCAEQFCNAEFCDLASTVRYLESPTPGSCSTR